ncbi:MAG: OB-fold domain-containing protein [Mycobacterium sp.]
MTSSPISAHPPRILPTPDDASLPYWTAGADGKLRIAHCASCSQYVHPPQLRCPQCNSVLDFVAMSGSGVLFTYTVSYQQFHPHVPTPFVIALVELDEQPGLRLVTNIVDSEPDSLYCGMPVQVRFEPHNTVFVPVFAPTDRS